MTLVQDLSDLLEDEFKAVTRGAYDRLPDILARKEKMRLALANRPPKEADLLRQLLSRSERNTRVIEAAGRGIARARQQIAEARLGRLHATYGKDGARRQIATTPGKIEQKY